MSIDYSFTSCLPSGFVGSSCCPGSPSSTFAGLVADIQDDLPIAGWVDLTKPLGLVQPVLGGKGLIIATAPGFAERVKGVANAKE